MEIPVLPERRVCLERLGLVAIQGRQDLKVLTACSERPVNRVRPAFPEIPAPPDRRDFPALSEILARTARPDREAKSARPELSALLGLWACRDSPVPSDP